MFSTTPLLPFHIRSAKESASKLEVFVDTEFLSYEVVITNQNILLVVDRQVGQLIESNDPMMFALYHFVLRNSTRVRELIK